MTPARVAAAERTERRWLLVWRGFAAVLLLAARTAAGVVQALLALAPIAGRPIAGRRAGKACSPEEAAGPSRRALPG